MELATRIFDVVTNPNNVDDRVRSLIPEITNEGHKGYWRSVLRMAALCHDIGHLPFSHAAEEELLPDGWSHEKITVEIINSEPMRKIWNQMTPPLRTSEISKLAVGQKHLPNETFSRWEDILSEIIVGDAFGADRMDYLLRDSLHTGVAYGRFDHYRLIDTLRVLPAPDGSEEPRLGIDIGGLHSAEALLLARYFMYSQVYFHHVRQIYDIHLIEFLTAWLPGGHFSTNVSDFLKINDVQVLDAIMKSSEDDTLPGHKAADRIISRNHLRRIYSNMPSDEKIYQRPSNAICYALRQNFESSLIRNREYNEKDPTFAFPILHSNDEIVSPESVSQVLSHVPVLSIGDVFVDQKIRRDVTEWLGSNKISVLEKAAQQEQES